MSAPAAHRATMNGKPVYTVPVKTVMNMSSGFAPKLLCDGPTLALGEGCAYSCSFCYVPSVYQKLDRVRELLAREGKRHEEVVILREAALDVLAGQLRHPDGTPKWKDPSDRRVIYASPADDVAANMDLVRATVAACALILEKTCWQIRLLSKSSLLPRVAAMLADEARRDGGARFTENEVYARMIFGFSTGTLDDRLAAAFEEGTPRVSKRIEALHVLQDAGFRTFGMVCPSLPDGRGVGYDHFARDMAEELRPEKLEHVWAEVINLRGESFKRTHAALRGAGFHEEANAIADVSADPEAWEEYNRATFLAHAKVYDQWVGKLRYLTYAGDRSRPWWEKQIARGAVIL